MLNNVYFASLLRFSLAITEEKPTALPADSVNFLIEEVNQSKSVL